MRYFFGHRLNLLPSTLVTSDEVNINLAAEEATLTVSGNAKILVNSIIIGNTAKVKQDDVVTIQATAPSILEDVSFYEIKQGSEIVGIFTVSSAQVPSLKRNDSYIGVPLHEVLPDNEDWELQGVAKIGTFVGGSYLELELPEKTFDEVPTNRIHILDPHRQLMYVLDAATGNYAGSLKLSSSPISEQTIHTSGIRIGTSILYDNGTLDILDNFYNIIKTITVGENISQLSATSSGVAVLKKNSIVEYTSPSYTETTTTFEYDINCAYHSVDDGILFVVTGKSLNSYIEGELVETIELPEVPTCIDVDVTGIYFGTGIAGRVISLSRIDDSIKTYSLEGNITYVSKSTNDNDIWASDFDKHLLYRIQPNSITKFEMTSTPIGVVAALGNTFSPMPYADLPARFTDTDRTPDEVTLGELQSDLYADVPITMPITGVAEAIEVTTPWLTNILYSNVSRPEITVGSDTNLELNFKARSMFYENMQVPIVYGDLITYLTVLPPEPESIPSNFYFNPVSNVDINTEVCSAPLDIVGLPDAAIIDMEVAGGTVRLNGVLTDSPLQIRNGDTVALCGTSSDNFFSTTLVTASILDLNVYFAITTVHEEAQLGFDVFDIESKLYEGLTSAVESETVELTYTAPDTTIPLEGQEVPVVESQTFRLRIPDIYGAYITKDGVNLGRSIEFDVAPDEDFFADVEFHLTTGNYPGKYYPLPVVTDLFSTIWLVRTNQSLQVKSFSFGSHDSPHMTEPVDSLEVTVEGITEDTLVPMVVPRGILVYINGNLQSSSLDYYGYPRESTKLEVELGDKITLRALPSKTYGDEVVHTITIGYTPGTFKITTPETNDIILDDLDYTVELTKPRAVSISGKLATFNALGKPVRHNINAPTLTTTKSVGIADNAEYLFGKTISVVMESETLIGYTRPILEVVRPVSGYQSNEIDYAVSCSVLETKDTAFTDNASYLFDSIGNLVTMVGETSTHSFEFGTVPDYTFMETVEVSNKVSSEWGYDTVALTSIKALMNYDQSRLVSDTLQDTVTVNSYKVNTNLFEYEFVHNSLWELTIPDMSANAGALRSPVQAFEVKDQDYIIESLYDVIGVDSMFPVELDSNNIGTNLFSELDPNVRPFVVDMVYSTHSLIVSNFEVVSIAFPDFEPQIGQKYVEVDLPEFEAYSQQRFAVAKEHPAEVFWSDTTYASSGKAIHNTLISLGESLGNNDYLKPKEPSYLVTPEVSVYNADQGKLFVDTNFTSHVSNPIDPNSSYYILFSELNEPETTLSGYFSTAEEAAQEAIAEGYEEGEYIITEVADKGFIWIVPMKCINTCYGKCPPEGYIKGG